MAETHCKAGSGDRNSSCHLMSMVTGFLVRPTARWWSVECFPGWGWDSVTPRLSFSLQAGLWTWSGFPSPFHLLLVPLMVKIVSIQVWSIDINKEFGPGFVLNARTCIWSLQVAFFQSKLYWRPPKSRRGHTTVQFTSWQPNQLLDLALSPFSARFMTLTSQFWGWLCKGLCPWTVWLKTVRFSRCL